MPLLNPTTVRENAIQNYNFWANDPFDRSSPIRMVVGRLLDSRTYMESIRSFQVPQNGLAIWFFGQNGFIVKAAQGPLIEIDLYLTDSCAESFAELPFRLNRQLPVFVEPEDLDVDVFLTTHSRPRGPGDNTPVHQESGRDFHRTLAVSPEIEGMRHI